LTARDDLEKASEILRNMALDDVPYSIPLQPNFGNKILEDWVKKDEDAQKFMAP